MARTNRRRTRSRNTLDRVTWIVLGIFLILSCVTGVLAFIWARSYFSSKTLTKTTDAPVVSGQNNNSKSNIGAKNSSPALTRPLQRETDPTPVAWDGASRVTVLIMGLDYRDWSEGVDIPRTDSMILLSVDPVNKTAGILSIPRDLWINIPGMGYNKINTAYRWGEIYKLPGGGPGLAMKTVEEFLGVPVNYYALIDFNAFVQMIDELGGLDMKIREEITIDPIGPGNTKVLEPGTQTLTGAEVLAYARQRHTTNDDFDRSARQQEVIMAIRKQVVQFHMLPTLITKAPKLYQEISSGVSTNLTLEQIIKLAGLGAQINERNIKKGVIGPPSQVEYATSPDGQAILIPVPDQIRILRDDIFASESVPVPVAAESTAVETVTTNSTNTATVQKDPAVLMKDERARVVLKNGTSTAGLASKTSELLKSKGVNIVSEDNADKNVNETTIYLFTSKPFTVKFLIDTLKVPESRVINRFDPKASADVEIVLGEDWASQQK